MDNTIIINNRYIVTDKIGEGGMGKVYRVADTLRNNAVFALKTIKSSVISKYRSDIFARFKREFEIMTRLKHPNLVRVYDFVTDSSENCYIVMEYIPGEPLGKIIKEEGRLGKKRAINILVDMLRALEFIHSRNIIYRDIKPDNIIICDDCAKLTDFGIADLEKVEREIVKGTLLFMAPEVLDGNITHLVDIFSLGAVFYQMITGNVFYQGSNYSLTTIVDVLKDREQFLSIKKIVLEDIPDPGIRKIIEKMTAFEKEKRFQSCVDVINCINRSFDCNYLIETKSTKESYVLGSPFINRKDEMRELIATLNSEGESELIVISGSLGSGKSRLLAEFKKYCQLNDIIFLDAYCSGEAIKPYGIFQQVLRRVFLHIDRAYIMQYAEYLKRVLPKEDLFRMVKINPVQDMVKEKEAVREAIVRMILEFIRKRGKKAVIAIDDIIYADEFSVYVCNYLIKVMKDPLYNNGLLRGIYLSVREDDTVSSRFFKELDSADHKKIIIKPFSSCDVQAYIENLFGKNNIDITLNDEIGAIAKKVGGNPYFLEEFIKMLVQDDIIERNLQKWSVKDFDRKTITLDHLRSIICQRVRSLELDIRQKKILSYLSLINMDLSVKETGMLFSEFGEDYIARFLHEMERQEILSAVSINNRIGYKISSDILREAISEFIEDKEYYHGSLGEMIENAFKDRLDDFAEEIAFHYHEGKNNEKALKFFKIAGNKAFRAYLYREAENIYEKALLLEEKRTKEYFSLLLKKIEILEKLNKWNEGINIIKDLEGQIKDKEQLGDLYYLLSVNYYNLADYQESFSASKKSLEFRMEAYGNRHPKAAESITQLGAIYYAKAEYKSALDFFNKALKIHCDISAGSELAIAEIYNDISVVHWQKGDYKDALDYIVKSLAIKLDLLGEYSPDLSVAYNNLGLIYSKLNEYDKALMYYEKSIKIISRLFGRRNLNTATELHNIGMVYEKKQMYNEALEYYKESIKIRKFFFRDGQHPDIANSYHNIGAVYIKNKNFEKALYFIQTARDIWLRYYGENHPNIAASYDHLGHIMLGLKKFSEAQEYFQKSIDIRISVYGPDHQEVIDSYNNFGNMYFRLNNYAKALHYYKIIYDHESGHDKGDNRDIINISRNMGVAFRKMGNFQMAYEYLKAAYDRSVKLLGDDAKETKDIRKIIQNLKRQIKNKELK